MNILFFLDGPNSNFLINHVKIGFGRTFFLYGATSSIDPLDCLKLSISLRFLKLSCFKAKQDICSRKLHQLNRFNVLDPKDKFVLHKITLSILLAKFGLVREAIPQTNLI